MYRTGCTSLHSIAVYLRFQLPPLHLANWDGIMHEMDMLMGASSKAARRIIGELDVEGTFHFVHFTFYILHSSFLVILFLFHIVRYTCISDTWGACMQTV